MPGLILLKRNEFVSRISYIVYRKDSVKKNYKLVFLLTIIHYLLSTNLIGELVNRQINKIEVFKNESK